VQSPQPPASVSQKFGVEPTQVLKHPRSQTTLPESIWFGVLAQTSPASTPLLPPVAPSVTVTVAMPVKAPQLKVGVASCDVGEFVSMNVPPVVDHWIIVAPAVPPSTTTVWTPRLAVCGETISCGLIESEESSGQVYVVSVESDAAARQGASPTLSP
jgi:hypothetical protein